MQSKNCINCIKKRVTNSNAGSYACNAIFSAILSYTYTPYQIPTMPKKIAYPIYILYYYYIYTTIYSLNGVFAFLAVQFFCNFLQFSAISAISSINTTT